MTPAPSKPIARLRTLWHNRNEPEYARAFANLYWRTLITVAIIVLIGIGAYAVSLFSMSLAELDTIAAKPATHSAPRLDQQALDSTVTTLTARLQAFQSLQAQGAPAVSDPGVSD